MENEDKSISLEETL